MRAMVPLYTVSGPVLPATKESGVRTVLPFTDTLP